MITVATVITVPRQNLGVCVDGEKALGEPLATNTKLRYWEGANTVRNRWSTSVLDAAGLETALTIKPGNHEMVD